MREIKFRGRRIDTGEWIYGLLTFMFGVYSIVEPKNENVVYPVESETIGQFTGIIDPNGKEIYEGDKDEYGYIVTYVDGSDSENLGMNIGFYLQRDNFESWGELQVGEGMEVVGSLYDNPELPEVESE